MAPAKAKTVRKRGRPPASTAAETRERLLEAAQRQFSTLGYDATTNKDIANAAGITTGAIYHYFESKRDLYEAVLDHVQEIVYERFGAAIAGVQGTVARIHAVLDAAVELEMEDPSLAAFIVAVPTEAMRHAEIADLAAHQQKWSVDFFGELAAQAHAEGDLAEDTDPAELTALLRAVAGGMARYATVAPREEYLAAMSGVKRLVEGSLLKAKPKRKKPKGKT